MKEKRGKGRSLGYNLVEVLVTLTIASIITITLVNFVNDVDMRHKVAIARADVSRIAEAAHLAEAEVANVPAGSSMTVLNLSTSSRLAWGLGTKLIEIPHEDPWGNRFVEVGVGTQSVSYVRATAAADATTASPYIVDEGLGRVISAGPDGVVDTHIGQDPADSESDIVVEYRHKPWLFYNAGGRMYVNSADGAASPTNTGGIDMGEGTNAQVSADGLRFTTIEKGNRLIVGTLAWATQVEGTAPEPRTDPVLIAPRASTISFSQNQWVSGQPPPQPSADTFPVWLPDSSGIVFVAGSALYRWDPSRGKQTRDSATDEILGEVIQLTDPDSVDGGGTSSGRTIGTTRRGAFNIDPGLGLYLVISGDGRIAYRAKGGSLALVLGDGTSKRILKTGNLCPLAWIDNNNIAYLDKTGKRIWRIAQDGTIDIPLHPDGQPSIADAKNPVLSSDGKYLAFLESESRGHVAKTDGTGFVSQANNLTSFEFGKTLLTAPRLVWRQALDAGGCRVLYVPSSESEFPVKIMQLDQKNLYKSGQSNAVSVSDPDSTVGESKQAFLLAGLTCQAFDLSKDEKMLAVVSPSDSTGRPTTGRGGVFILPLTGRSRAMTKLSPPTLPTAGGYSYVAWLLN